MSVPSNWSKKTLSVLALLTMVGIASAQSPPVAPVSGEVQHYTLDLESGAIFEGAPATPDASVVSFSNTTMSSLTYPQFPFQEDVDWGVKASGLSGLVDSIRIGYATSALDPSVGGPGAALIVRLYSGTTGNCATNPGEPGTLARALHLSGMPSSKTGAIVPIVLTIDLGDDAAFVPDGPIGWSYETLDSKTGPLLIVVGIDNTSTVDKLDSYAILPTLPAICTGSFNVQFAGVSSFYLALSEIDNSTPASATVRNGNDVNPLDYVVTHLPVVGQSFQATIGVDPSVPISILALSEFSSAGVPNPFGPGELLLALDPYVPIIDISNGAHSLLVPVDVSMLGKPVYTQGFRVEIDTNGDVVFSARNGVDLVVGT